MALIYVADTSALARLARPTVAARLGPLLIGGDVATCSVVELEALFSAKSPADLEDFDLIGRVTGQPVEWVVPAGSVP